MGMLRSSLSSIVYHGSRLLGQKETGTRILCYHRVNDIESKYTTVPIFHFRSQMRFLAECGYNTISLNDVVKMDKVGANPCVRPNVNKGQTRGSAPTFDLSRSLGEGGKPIVITFDDGYRDNYENAYPILREYGFRATIFCIGQKIGEPTYLTREDILEMQGSGFEFGSHTLSHPDLPNLDRVRKEQEIAGSKRFLEELLGTPCEFFCYPSGLFDEETIEVVEEAGYRGSCSNTPGTNREIVNPYLLRRTEISALDTLHDFRKKLAGSYDFLHQTLHWMRGRP